jgi:5-methylcytosine-specific restriction endonuclease McrA
MLLTFMAGVPIHLVANRVGHSERAVRRWIRDYWDSGDKCAIFSCMHSATKHQCPRHWDCRRYEYVRRNRFVNTAAWKKARRWFIESHPLCGMRLNGGPNDSDCLRASRRSRATIVDHMDAHAGDGWDFWDINNWQALCASCHGRKTAMFDGAFGRTIYPL